MATIARYIPGSTATFTATIRDAAGSAVSSASITTATLTLKNGSTIINGRNAQNVLNTNNVTINTDGGLVWSIQTADVDASTHCEHVATFTIVTTSNETIVATHRMYISPTLALTSYEEVSLPLGELSESDQLYIQQLIDALTDRAETYAGVRFAYVTGAVEVFSPHPERSSVRIKHVPIDTVTDLREDEDGDFGTDAVIDAEDYFVNKELGQIELRGGATFLGGPGSVQVTYSGGYKSVGDVPMQLRMAATEQVAYSYQRRSSMGVTSESVNGMSVTRYVTELLPAFKNALDQICQKVVI